MSQAIMAQKQKTLAEAAQANPEHRFTNLYSLMHWDYWIRTAMDTVLARPGSTTAGVDGKKRDYFKDHYEDTVKLLVTSLTRLLCFAISGVNVVPSGPITHTLA